MSAQRDFRKQNVGSPSHALTVQGAAAAPLRLFVAPTITDHPDTIPAPLPGSAGRSPPGLTRHSKLSEMFESYFLPVYLIAGKKSPQTIKLYKQVIALWVRFTGDPPLDQLDQYLIVIFLERLEELPGLRSERIAPNTVRKLCLHLQCVLDHCGPRDRKHRLATNLLAAAEVPWLQKPPQEIGEVENCFTQPQFADLLAACQTAKAPRSLYQRPPRFWLNLLLFIYNSAARIEATLGLKFAYLQRDAAGLWLLSPAENNKQSGYKRRSRTKRFCVNAACEAVIEDQRSALRARDDDFIFPWPHTFGYLEKVRRQLLEAAKITTGAEGERTELYGFHAIRKLAITEMQEINPAAAKLFAGHSAGRDVTLDHYTHRRLLSAACAKLPQPPTPEWAVLAKLPLFPDFQ